MILTDRFVYLHQPKTGGTFVSTALFELYGAGWSRRHHLRFVLQGRVAYRSPRGTLILQAPKHGTRRSIPASDAALPILATVRNPFDHYVSQYEFGWWKRWALRRYLRRVPGFRERYPHFPALTFAEYVRLANEAFWASDAPDTAGHRLGVLSREFVKYYFPEPEGVLAELNGDRCLPARFRRELDALHFIPTSRLNRGLHRFLLEQGYPAGEIEFILHLGKILPEGQGRRGGRERESYYTAALMEQVRQQEWLLFELFPEFEHAVTRTHLVSP